MLPLKRNTVPSMPEAGRAATTSLFGQQTYFADEYQVSIFWFLKNGQPEKVFLSNRDSHSASPKVPLPLHQQWNSPLVHQKCPQPCRVAEYLVIGERLHDMLRRCTLSTAPPSNMVTPNATVAES